MNMRTLLVGQRQAGNSSSTGALIGKSLLGLMLVLAPVGCQSPVQSDSGAEQGGGSGKGEGEQGNQGGSGKAGSGSAQGSGGSGGGGAAGPGATGGSGSGSGGAGGAEDPSPPPDAGPIDPPPGNEDPPPDAAATADAAEPGNPAAMNSPACAAGAMAPEGGIHTLQAAGLQRRFLLRLPPGYDNKKPWPVIFAFHGAGNQNATSFENRIIGFKRVVENDAVLVYGESLERPNGNGRSWQAEEQLPANLAYIDAIMEWLSERVCFAKNRVFAAGQSSGAYFAQTLGCHRGDVFRAVASSDGGERYFRDCKGNPGAFIRYRPTGANAADSRKARDFILERNSCSRETEKTDLSQCVSYLGCQNGVRVWECTDGGSHDWPAYMDRGVWTFFSGF